MFRFLNYFLGTALAIAGVLLLLIYLASPDFRSYFSDRVDEAEQVVSDRVPDNTTGAEAISPQALVNLSESIVEIQTPGGGSGTGVIITEGYPWTVLTAAHVADRATGSVRRPGRDWGRAELVAVDYGPDVAVLRVTFPPSVQVVPVTVPPLSSVQPKAGDGVATRCYRDAAIRKGMVLDIVERVGDIPNLFTNIAAEGGCSGAPLVNAAGDLVGVLIQGSDESSVAVAISALASRD